MRCLTIDVEDYYHIEAARHRLTRRHWDYCPQRVRRGLNTVLGVLAKHRRRGTFFVLSDVARRFPDIVPALVKAGHEVASHGGNHDRLHRLDERTFRSELRASKRLLEDQGGQPVIGFRAPTFSVVPRTAWAVDVLVEEGFVYDASVFPVRHPSYGVPDAPLTPFWLQSRPGHWKLLEAPPLVWDVAGRHLPVAGGGYFRLLPLELMLKGLEQAQAERRPAVLYFHPWEFDPGIPRLPLGWLGRLRTYTGLSAAAGRLDRIVSQPADWRPMVDALDEFRRFADRQPALALAA